MNEPEDSFALLQACMGITPPEGQETIPVANDFVADDFETPDSALHPLSGSGYSYKDTKDYYYNFGQAAARSLNDTINGAEFADVNPHNVCVSFINELVRLDPNRWGLFLKNNSASN